MPLKRIALTAFILATAAAPAPAAAVEVRVEQRTYPVQEGKHRSNIAPDHAPKLEGRSSYTTTAVVLANRYLELTVLPELGGRLVRVRWRPTGEDLFWVHDAIQDGVSWSMGGGRWSFPFWEHGRHFDETGGYVVRHREDGGVTVAVDMRFDRYLTAAETRRYGRATNLRLAQTVALAPEEARFTWRGRVTNPLPVRCGFKLWYLLRQPAVDGTRVILPAAAVTGHGTRDLVPWDHETVVRDLQTSVFAIGIRHDFAGWFFPARNLNVLRLQDRRLAPGAKQVLYRPSSRGYIEMWGGNHEVFEECGRLLPPFGAYEMAVTVLPAKGIGRADLATRDAAVACRKDGETWHVAVAPARPLDGYALTLEAGGRSVAVRGEACGPEAPAHHAAALPGDRMYVRFAGPDGAVLVDETLPVEAGPMPKEAFAAAKARTDGTMPGGKGLYAECTDLVSEHQLSLPRAAGMHRKVLESEDAPPREVLDAARRLMRVERGSEAVRTALARLLEHEPANPWAHLYLGMWLLEADRAEEADAHLGKALDLPGARYLAALRAQAQGDPAAAERHLRALLAMGPEAAFHGEDDPGRALLQPGATVEAARPRLLLALVLRAQGKAAEATAVLEALAAEDPAVTEAWMLLGDAEAVRTLTAANPVGREAAEATLAALRDGRWRGIGRPD